MVMAVILIGRLSCFEIIWIGTRGRIFLGSVLGSGVMKSESALRIWSVTF